MLLALAFGVGVGVFNAMTSLLAQLIAPNGYTPTDAGLFAAVLIGVGLAGAAVAGVLLDRTRAFVAILRTAFVGATVAMVFFVLFNHPGQKVELYFICGFLPKSPYLSTRVCVFAPPSPLPHHQQKQKAVPKSTEPRENITLHTMVEPTTELWDGCGSGC